MNIWDQIKGLIASKISTEAFENWMSKTVLIRSEGSRLWVGVPDVVTKDWILQEYTSDIWSAIRDLSLPLRQIVYEVQDSAPPLNGKNTQHNGTHHGSDDKSEIVFSPSMSLTSTFRVASFVLVSCNQWEP